MSKIGPNTLIELVKNLVMLNDEWPKLSGHGCTILVGCTSYIPMTILTSKTKYLLEDDRILVMLLLKSLDSQTKSAKERTFRTFCE